MKLIHGFRQLSETLEGWRTIEALRCLDRRNTLGLSRQWYEGKRTFDPAEVQALQARIKANDPTLPKLRKKTTK